MAEYVWKKPSSAFTLFTIMSILGLLALGGWQISRMEWKENIITNIATANEQAPLTFDQIPDKAEDYAELGFRKAKIRGTFISDVEFHIAARFHKSQQGYHVHTPFRMEDDRIILLNRGWIPVDLKNPEQRPDSIAEGWQELEVQIRTDNDATSYTHENQPINNMWFHKEIEIMSADSSYKLVPFAADVVGDNNQKTLPVPSSGDIDLRNDHFQYSLTWFGMALCILLFYVGGHYKKKDA